MKKIYSLLFLGLISTATFAQSWNVPEKNTGLVTKITATWCGPCGGWGWTAMEEISDSLAGKHNVISLYAPSSSKLYNPGAAELADEIGYGGTPNFSALGVDFGTASSMVYMPIDSFVNAPTIANSAYEILTVSDDSVTILVKTKFFQEVNGNFIVKPFWIENHAVEEQNGFDDPVEHHNVHRGNFTSLDTTSQYVMEGSAGAGETVTTKFVMVFDEEWILSESYIGLSLWMENPTDSNDLIYVNGSREAKAGELVIGYGIEEEGETGGGTPGDWQVGVEEIAALELDIFPNPAKEMLNFKMNQSTDYTIVMTDLLGKTVYSQSFLSSNFTSINVMDMVEGVYMIEVKTDQGSMFDRVVIK